MQYLAKFMPDENAILVSFPDVPEAITGGADEVEAFKNAQEALELALLNHIALGEPLPKETTKSIISDNSHIIYVSAQIQAKIGFISAFKQSGLTRVALAKKLGKAENEIRRMLDPYHVTKLPALEAGLLALGKRLVIGVEAA